MADDLAQQWSRIVRPAPVPWFTTPAPPRKWLLSDNRRTGAPGLLPLGKTGMLIAEGGAGKTQILCQLAISVATAHPFLEWFVVNTPGRVLMLMGEEDEEEMHRRLYAGSRAGGPTPEAGMITTLPLSGIPCAMLEADERGRPMGTEFSSWLLSYLSEGEKYALVIIDPMSRFAGVDAETNNAHATRYVQSTERIAALTGATVINSHHSNKIARGGVEMTSAASRGSSAFTDGHRWVATLSTQSFKATKTEPAGESLTLSFTKSNYARRGEPIELRRDEHGAIVPLDDEEGRRIGERVSGTANRRAKAEEKEQEREQARLAKRLTDANEREAKLAKEGRERQARDQDDDRTAAELLRANPLATVRELVAMLKASRACGGTRAHDAILRASRPVRQGGVPAVPVQKSLLETGTRNQERP